MSINHMSINHMSINHMSINHTCINIQNYFGNDYLIKYDESRPKKGNHDPWLMIIPCKYGHIYPYGDDELALSIDGHAKIANKVRRMDCCNVYQDGDYGELTAIFNISDFDKIVPIIKPRRRPRISEGVRKARCERLNRWHQKQKEILCP